MACLTTHKFEAEITVVLKTAESPTSNTSYKIIIVLTSSNQFRSQRHPQAHNRQQQALQLQRKITDRWKMNKVNRVSLRLQ
jgi:hypothetical protein